MAQSALGNRGGDFAVHVESFQRCFTTGTLTLGLGGTADGGLLDTQVAGTPGSFSAGVFTAAVAGGEAGVDSG